MCTAPLLFRRACHFTKTEYTSEYVARIVAAFFKKTKQRQRYVPFLLPFAAFLLRF
jgi:hypothetical protein